MAKSGAWKAPKDLTITERQTNGYWSDKSQDREQTAAPELRTATQFSAGWPDKISYRIQSMHMDLDGQNGDVGIMDSPKIKTDGRGREAARTDRGPESKGQFASNRGARIKRNTYAQRGNTG